MRKILLLLLLAPVAFAQSPARYDMPVMMTTPGQNPVGSLPPLLAVTNATIAVCGYPAVLSGGSGTHTMCTNTITTYTDSTLGTACPASAQLTAPGTSVCVSTTGLQGSFGFWYDASVQSHLTYTLKTSWGIFGPFDILPGGSDSSTCADCLLTDPSGTQNTTALTLTNKNFCLQDGTNCPAVSASGECFLGIGGLVGAFTDGSGVIKGSPLCLGDGPTSVTTPTGATQLQLGIDDDMYAHVTPNAGSFTINVVKNGGTAVPVTVAGTAMPWNTTVNSAYPYGLNDGTSATTAITGLTGGDVITVSYASGTVSVWPGTYPFTDANGWLTSPPGAAGKSGPTDSILSPTSTWWPTKYMTSAYAGGGVVSVFGRTGIVTAQAGDYTVSQITGAAPVASPTFTGTVTLPVTGSTQCLHVNSSGAVSGTGSDCGSGGSGVSSLNALTGALSITGDSTITVTPGGSSIALHATGSGGTGGSVFESRVLNSAEQEYLSCAAGATCQLMNVSGAGTLVSIDLSEFGVSTCNGTMLYIVVDGNVVVAAPIGIVFGAFGQGPCGGGTTQVFSSPKLSLNEVTANNIGGIIHWTIPFSTSLAVYMRQDSGSSATSVFFNGDYYSGAAPANLYPSQWAHFNSYYATQNVAQYATMFWLPTFPGAGALESVQIYGSGGSGLTSLEGDPSLSADGGSYIYNGTEDFFCGSSYFGTSKGNISGSCGSSFIGTTNFGMFRFFDLYPTGTDVRPVPFNSSLTISGPNGQSGQGAGPGAISEQSLVTWYSTAQNTVPAYTGNQCQNFISSTSTSQTCVIKVFQAGDAVVGFTGLTSLTSATATCGTVNTIRTISWAAGAVNLVVFDIPNATAGSCTITLSYPSQANVNSMAVDIANANVSSPIDNSSCTSSPFCSSTGTGATITSGGSITTAGADELVIGFATYGLVATVSGGPQWNFVAQSVSIGQSTTYLPGFAANTYTPAFAVSGGGGGNNWVTSTIAIKH